MVDRDWYDGNVPRNWRGVARRIEAGEDVVYIGDLALHALAETLRKAHGVPGLDEFVEVVHEYPAGITIPQAFARLRDMSLEAGGSPLTQVAQLAAESTIVAIDRRDIREDFTREVYRRFVSGAFERFLFGPGRQHWVGSRFTTVQEAHEWQRQCIQAMAPRIEKFVDSMERHPSGAGLRAPRRQTPRRTTAYLLSESVT